MHGVVVSLLRNRNRSYSAFALPVEASLIGPPTPHISAPKALVCLGWARAFLPRLLAPWSQLRACLPVRVVALCLLVRTNVCAGSLHNGAHSWHVSSAGHCIHRQASATLRISMLVYARLSPTQLPRINSVVCGAPPDGQRLRDMR
jgi:hypothetical protein